MIIGLTGTNASGKGTVAEYLVKEKKFKYFSLSDILREECEREGLEPTRETLIRLGIKMRSEYGPAVLASRIIDKITGSCVVDSIRNVAEAQELRKLPDFILVGVDAPVDIRFKRAELRKRTGETLTLEDFIRKEEEENGSEESAQQLGKCMELADKVIINDKF